MQLVTETAIAEYLRTDPVLQQLQQAAPMTATLTCQQWLMQTPAKRFIYQSLYGDLLAAGPKRTVTDVGGGLTALTQTLARQHQYTLIDMLAHDTAEAAEILLSGSTLHAQDWLQYAPTASDIVIANDLFPNVDQRLELFLKHFLPHTRRIRLSLTYYENDRYYLTKRIGADEILCMLAWDSRQLKHCLAPFASRVLDYRPEIIGASNPSAYTNGRQVCLIELQGDR